MVNLNPARGSEPGKIRSAVVIQTNLLNQLDHPSTLICPITTQLSAEENILRVRLDSDGTGLEKGSEILVDQIRALDNRRFL
ncbi:MAG: type II toxin-antitoxin system PemK/MazF family toxin, partial [Algoriphagus sp.]|nr:type II toxin-antitoxin system PemK/MazF family toxin [Algoriphagus sp.]